MVHIFIENIKIRLINYIPHETIISVARESPWIVRKNRNRRRVLAYRQYLDNNYNKHFFEICESLKNQLHFENEEHS